MDAELKKIVEKLQRVDERLMGIEIDPFSSAKAELFEAIAALRSYVPPRTEVVITEAEYLGSLCTAECECGAELKKLDGFVGNVGESGCNDTDEITMSYCWNCGKRIVWQLSKDGE